MSSFKICCFGRREFAIDSSIPTDIGAVFDKYAKNGLMGKEQLKRFLMEEQGETNISDADAQNVIDSYLREVGKNVFGKLRRLEFSKDTFFDYLLSATLNPAIRSTVHHDMTAPISHYFIYTGHNSYLTGNQLSSTCSERPIIEALRRGVRVIELDIWPNSSNDEVMVLHGRTMTSPVEFKKCIVAIIENAFVTSQYPVVITLEDHLTTDLQAKVAQVVTSTFGDILFYPDTEKELTEFPSPESLKGRILISTKPPKEYLKGDKSAAEKVKVDENHKEEEHWGDEIFDFREQQANSNKNMSVPTGTQEEEESSDDESKHLESREVTHVAPEYKRIITIHAGKPKGKSTKDALVVSDKYVKRVSLSEPQLAKLAEEYSTLVVRFTQRNLLRIYPYGLRIDSSNYSPVLAWMHGAQMVALNMQGYGRSLWLVQGFFRANGGCGYVKKPNFLLSNPARTQSGQIFNPYETKPVKMTLKVKVHMGRGWIEQFSKTHFDRFSPPDFYTRIGIAGVPSDTIMKKTPTIEDNWAPHWNSEFEFPLTVPELALLRIEVHESDMSARDDFGGQICLPVSELRPGIRTVSLCDKKGQEYSFVRLLMHFHFVPSSSSNYSSTT
eukprot:c28877_g1_i2 orf=370-2205(-)